MKFLIRWRSRRSVDPERVRTRRMEHVLRAAHHCSFYSSKTPFRGLLAIRNPKAAIAHYPELPLAEFLRNPAAFELEDHPEGPVAPPRVKLPDAGRVLVLGRGFSESDDVRALRHGSPEDWLEDWREFRPDTLAGPVSRLRKAALDVLSGALDVPRLERAVVAFTGLRDGLLEPRDRDLLWRGFGVPVFEQFRGFSGEPLAWECEAQEGLHIEAPNAYFETADSGDLLLTCLDDRRYALVRLNTELRARLLDGECGCGRPGVRLAELRGRGLAGKKADGADPALSTPSGAPLAAYDPGELVSFES